MAEPVKKDPVTTEPSEEKPSESDSTGAIKELGKGAFAKIQREIDEKDLNHPVVGKLLLNERDRLFGEKAILEDYRDKYYEADKRAAVLEEKGKSENKFKILYSFTLAIGGILIGAAFSIPNNLPLQIALGLLGAVSIIASIFMAFKE